MEYAIYKLVSSMIFFAFGFFFFMVGRSNDKRNKKDKAMYANPNMRVVPARLTKRNGKEYYRYWNVEIVEGGAYYDGYTATYKKGFRKYSTDDIVPVKYDINKRGIAHAVIMDDELVMEGINPLEVIVPLIIVIACAVWGTVSCARICLYLITWILK